jgi:hypothetical protein
MRALLLFGQPQEDYMWCFVITFLSAVSNYLLRLRR